MRTVTLDVAVRTFEQIANQVLADAEAIAITTPSGECAVVMPLSDFTAWKETAYLRSSPANAAQLRESTAEATMKSKSE